MPWIVCEKCGGKTHNMDKHVNGVTRSCRQRWLEHMFGRFDAKYRARGWLPTSTLTRSLSLINPKLIKYVPAVAFQGRVSSMRGWAPSWAVAVITLRHTSGNLVMLKRRRDMVVRAMGDEGLQHEIMARSIIGGDTELRRFVLGETPTPTPLPLWQESA